MTVSERSRALTHTVPRRTRLRTSSAAFKRNQTSAFVLMSDDVCSAATLCDGTVLHHLLLVTTNMETTACVTVASILAHATIKRMRNHAQLVTRKASLSAAGE